MRLDRVLSNTGMVTRSGAKEALKAGRVQVNHIPERDGSRQVNPDTDEISLDGERLLVGRVVLLLNKPAGYVTSTKDPRDPTVLELLPRHYRKILAPVGRLDKDTEGLLLLTNDGPLAHKLISPKYEVSKRYYAKHEGTAGPEDVQAFAEGLTLGDGSLCKPAVLEPIGPGESLITITQGMYHQVRRMMASRKMTVLYLERREEGPLSLGDLPRGEFRLLNAEEVAALCGE